MSGIEHQVLELVRLVHKNVVGHDVSRGMLKGLIKRKENLTAKIATIQYQMDQNKDAVVDFKQMGIDHIFVDESHQFKNLMFNTARLALKPIIIGL